MNKKLLIAYILAALIVIYVIYVYSTRHVAKPRVAEAPPPAAPEIPMNQEAAAERTRNNELINKYTDQIKKSDGTDGDLYYQRGLIYLKLQQSRLAIQDFSAALRLVPDSPNALYARALAYQKENDLVRSLADLNAAINLKNDFAAAYNIRAIIYDEQGHTDEAINDYKNAIAINPNFDQAYYNLGIIYEKQKQYEEAAAEYSSAISNNVVASDATPAELADAKKRLLQAYIHRAGVELLMNDLEPALKDATYVVDNDPKNEAAFRLRSDIYTKMGRTVEGLADKATADNLSMQNLLEQR
jgi:tetratricopeptide (TPR) repeat protein